MGAFLENAELLHRVKARFDSFPQGRTDADESVFFLRELDYIIAQPFMVEYPEFKARTLLPVDTSAGPAAEHIAWRMFDKVGAAKIVRDYSNDLPRVDLLGKENLGVVQSLGDSFAYSIQEIRAARRTGRPLDAMRAEVAREAILRKENALAWTGSTAFGLAGALNNANANVVTLAADGTGASKTWATKTPEQILRDLQQLVNTIFINTNGVEVADTVCLPVSVYPLVTSKKLGIESETVLSFFLKSCPFIKNVTWLPELTAAGTAQSDMVWAYRRDPTKLRLSIPQDVEFFPPQERGLEFIIHGHSRMGGVQVHKPMSMAYASYVG